MPRNKRGNRRKREKQAQQFRPYPYPPASYMYQPHPMPPYNPYPYPMMPQPMAQNGVPPMMYPPFMPMPYPPYAAPTQPQPVQATPSTATPPPLQGGLPVPPVPAPPAPATQEKAPQPTVSQATVVETKETKMKEATPATPATPTHDEPGVPDSEPDDLDVCVTDSKEKSQEGGRRRGVLNKDTKSKLESSAAAIKEQTKSGQSQSLGESHDIFDCSEEITTDEVSEDEATATKRILAELNEVPHEMMASEEDMKRLKQEASSLLKIVKTEKCRNYLRKIAYGESPSERHNDYLQCGMLMSGQGPFTLFDDLRNDLLETLNKYCYKHTPTYQYSVLLPEAIIYGAKIHFAFSQTKAIEYFERSSKIVASATSP